MEMILYEGKRKIDTCKLNTKKKKRGNKYVGDY